MACFQFPITHQCITAFVLQSFCMGGRGTWQSSCWLYLQLVKIRERQMVSHGLFCSCPQPRQLGRQTLPPHSSQATAQKETRLLLTKLQFIIQKNKGLRKTDSCNCQRRKRGKKTQSKKQNTNLEVQLHCQMSAINPKPTWWIPKAWEWGMSFGCRHMRSLGCFTSTSAGLISRPSLKNWDLPFLGTRHREQMQL